ncbi:hypothetical protein TNIN_78071, partial [Trichonephila inaurata madagascariensis]
DSFASPKTNETPETKTEFSHSKTNWGPGPVPKPKVQQDSVGNIPFGVTRFEDSWGGPLGKDCEKVRKVHYWQGIGQQHTARGWRR